MTIIRLRETPKCLLAAGRDEQVVGDFREMAARYNRSCSITLAKLQSCGSIHAPTSRSKLSIAQVFGHLRGLSPNKKLGYSTILVWLSWSLIGIGYPLYYVFLPSYLNSRGAAFGHLSTYETWRNYVLVVFCGLWVSEESIKCLCYLI